MITELEMFVLQPTRTQAHRSLIIYPGAEDWLCVAELRESAGEGRKETVSRYGIKKLPHLGYQLIKSGGKEKYSTALIGYGLCDCTGFLQYGHCKHLDIIRIVEGLLKCSH